MIFDIIRDLSVLKVIIFLSTIKTLYTMIMIIILLFEYFI